jgi:hypothetical protein
MSILECFPIKGTYTEKLLCLVNTGITHIHYSTLDCCLTWYMELLTTIVSILKKLLQGQVFDFREGLV